MCWIESSYQVTTMIKNNMKINATATMAMAVTVATPTPKPRAVDCTAFPKAPCWTAGNGEVC